MDSQIPELINRPKLLASGMSPIMRGDFINLLKLIGQVEGENVQNLGLENDTPSRFSRELLHFILDELEIIERTYRLKEESGYDWYDFKKGPYLSAVSRSDFQVVYPEQLAESFEISENYARFIKDLVKVFIKPKIQEIVKFYGEEFIETEGNDEEQNGVDE